MKKRNFWQRIKTPPKLPTAWSWVVTLGLLLVAAVGLTCLCLVIGTVNFQWIRFRAYLDDPQILLFNFAPIFLSLFLCYVLDNKAWVAYVTTGLLFVLISFANYYKVMLRGEVFTFSDFTLVKEGAGIAGNYQFPLPIWVFIAIGLLLGGALVLARYGRARFTKKKKRLAAPASADSDSRFGSGRMEQLVSGHRPLRRTVPCQRRAVPCVEGY